MESIPNEVQARWQDCFLHWSGADRQSRQLADGGQGLALQLGARDSSGQCPRFILQGIVGLSICFSWSVEKWERGGAQ